MTGFQIESIEPPFAESPRLTHLILALLARAQTMSLLPADSEGHLALDASTAERLVREISAAGIAVGPAVRLRGADEQELEQLLDETLAAVDASPYPRGEWQPARELLGDDLLARLVGDISHSSLRRYASGERETPDEVAWRLHVVARLLASLLGSYNDYGVRRWFERSRSALGGETPSAVVASAADEEDPELQRVFVLADSLVGSGAVS